MIREDNNDAIWVIFGHAKFHIPDPATLTRLYPATAVVQVFAGCLAGIANAPANGTLLRDDNGAIWVIFGRAKFHVPDLMTFGRLYGAEPVCHVWNGAVDGLANIPADGTMLREENGAVWIIFGGAKFHVPDLATLSRLYVNLPIWQVWTGALNAIPDIPIDRTLLREENGTVWVIYGGAKFHVPYSDPATLNHFFPYMPIHQLWNGAVGPISTVPAEGTLLLDDTETPWAILGSAKFRVPSYLNLQSFFHGAVFGLLPWSGALGSISLIPRDGYLIREFSNPQVYVIQGGRKVPTQPPAGAAVAIIWDGGLSQVPG